MIPCRKEAVETFVFLVSLRILDTVERSLRKKLNALVMWADSFTLFNHADFFPPHMDYSNSLPQRGTKPP